MRQQVYHSQYGFPVVTLEPDSTQTVEVKLNDVFRAERMHIHATWDAIRGNYRIKRSRLPLINREDVFGAFTQIKRRASKRARAVPGRTVMLFEHPVTGKLVTRDYKHDSVQYWPIDAAHHVVLSQMRVDAEATLPNTGGGISAEFLNASAMGNAIPAPSGREVIRATISSTADIPIRVAMMLSGRSYKETNEPEPANTYENPYKNLSGKELIQKIKDLAKSVTDIPLDDDDFTDEDE